MAVTTLHRRSHVTLIVTLARLLVLRSSLRFFEEKRVLAVYFRHTTATLFGPRGQYKTSFAS